MTIFIGINDERKVNVMGEQERYKNMLKKLITETENEKIQSTEELIQMLISELKNTAGLKATF